MKSSIKGRVTSESCQNIHCRSMDSLKSSYSTDRKTSEYTDHTIQSGKHAYMQKRTKSGKVSEPKK